MPCFTDAYSNQRIKHCCKPPHAALMPCQALYHMLCVTTGNARGSSNKIHDIVKFAVQAVCKDVGLTTFTEPIGEIPATANLPDTTTGKRPDIRVDGLREIGIIILLDISITHTMN